ncbi:hypothetical protein BJV78DRAFT_1352945 [Lactifluus subvellereus]|nr:hypothetical protein BJV78DRAFT_1352945 [Lactifluus subvellereus]
MYPGAHLSLDKRRSLALVTPHLTLYAFPKAFLSTPDAPYSKPYKPRPYPGPPRRPEQRSVDMLMQVIAFNSRVVLSPTVRTKIKRRLKEVVRLTRIVTRGAAVHESRRESRIAFRAEDVGADKWIVPDWTYIALPMTEMFRMPFTEQIALMRKALRSLHRHIPEVERILRRNGRRDATSLLVRSPQKLHVPPSKGIYLSYICYQNGKSFAK